MNTTLKKISVYLCIILLVSPLCFIFVSHIRQQVIWHQMKARMKNGPLQTLKIHEKDVIWMDQHEIRVYDMMFDIHSQEYENGIYTFTGLFDKEETLLMKKQSAAGQENTESHKWFIQIFQHLQSLFCLAETNGPVPAGAGHHENNWLSFLITDPYIPFFTPPPQRAVSE